MREFIHLVETYVDSLIIPLNEKFMGTYSVKTDWGSTEQAEIFENPSRIEVMKLLRSSEYASVRASLYPEKDLLIVWVGDRVQHHDVDHLLFGAGERYFIRLFFDRTGISVNPTDDEEADAHIMKDIHASSAIRKIFGSDFEVQYS